MAEAKIIERVTALRDVLTQTFGVSESDTDFILGCHGEDIEDEILSEESCYDVAERLLATASEWGDYDDLVDL